MPEINHEILVWARKSAGLSLRQAASKLNIKNGSGTRAIERLVALESAEEKPSRAMLLQMAQCYRRSLLTFYLEKPPITAIKAQDFRQLPSNYSPSDEVLLEVLVRNIKTRQALVRDVLEDEAQEKLPFIGRFCLKTSQVEDLVKSLKETLKIDLDACQSQTNPQQTFELLRRKAEQAGVFVLLIGDLGSGLSRISPTLFRGIADADPFAPFVVINANAPKRSWPLTLLHELAHLWLRESGVSNEDTRLKIEQICSEVAAGILFPQLELKSLQGPSPLDCREEEEQTEEEDQSSNDYSEHKFRLSPALIALVARAMNEGRLSTTKAAKILAVYPRDVDSLICSTQQTSQDLRILKPERN